MLLREFIFIGLLDIKNKLDKNTVVRINYPDFFAFVWILCVHKRIMLWTIGHSSPPTWFGGILLQPITCLLNRLSTKIKKKIDYPHVLFEKVI